MKRDKLWRFAESHIFFFFFLFQSLKKSETRKICPKESTTVVIPFCFQTLKKKKKKKKKIGINCPSKENVYYCLIFSRSIEISKVFNIKEWACVYMSRLMRLWHLSPSINSIFKHACAAIHWGYTSDFLSDPSSTSILYVCEQRRLWRDCANAQSRLSLRFRLCDKNNNLKSLLI